MLRALIFCALLTAGAIAQLLPESSGDGLSPFEEGGVVEESSGAGIDGSGAEPAEVPVDTQKCPPKLDVVFLLDTSGSIKGIYQEHVRWTVALVDTLPVDKDSVRVAAVQYAGFPLTEFALGTYPKGRDIREHLEKMEFRSGVTRTGDALRRAETELFRPDRGGRQDAAKVIVLFTDGLSIDDPLKPAIELRNIMSVKIFVVGLSPEGFMAEMDAIAGNKQRVFGPDDLNRLRAALLREVDAARRCRELNKQSNSSNSSEQPKPVLQPIDEESDENLQETGQEQASTTVAVGSTSEAAVGAGAEKLSSANGEKVTEKASEKLASASGQKVSEKVAEPLKNVEKAEKQSPSSGQPAKVAEKVAEKAEKLSSSNGQPAKVAEPLKKVESPETTSTASAAKLNGAGSATTEAPSTTSSGTTTAAPKVTLKTTTPLAAPIVPARRVAAAAAQPQHFERLVVAPSSSNSLDDNEVVETLSPRRTTVRTPTLRTTTARTIELEEEEPRVTEDPQIQAKLNARGRGNLPAGSCPLDILFILDSSGSVQYVYEEQKSFIESVLAEVQISERDHRVALLQFAGDELQKTEWSFDTYEDKSLLMNAFHGVRHFTGTTYIGAALTHARQLLDSRRRNVRTLVLLVSDGYTQDDAEPAAQAIRQIGQLKMYAISLAKLNNIDYLTTLAGDREHVFVGAQEVDSLKRILRSEMACRRV